MLEGEELLSVWLFVYVILMLKYVSSVNVMFMVVFIFVMLS